MTVKATTDFANVTIDDAYRELKATSIGLTED